MLVTGFLSASWWGWPAVFYCYGTLSLIWILLMVKFGCNDPAVHKKIKEEEKLYISNGSARSEGEEVKYSAITSNLHKNCQEIHLIEGYLSFIELWRATN